MGGTEEDNRTNRQSRAVYINRAIDVAEHLQAQASVCFRGRRNSRHEVDLFDNETAQAMADEDDRPILTLHRHFSNEFSAL